MFCAGLGVVTTMSLVGVQLGSPKPLEITVTRTMPNISTRKLVFMRPPSFPGARSSQGLRFFSLSLMAIGTSSMIWEGTAITSGTRPMQTKWPALLSGATIEPQQIQLLFVSGWDFSTMSKPFPFCSYFATGRCKQHWSRCQWSCCQKAGRVFPWFHWTEVEWSTLQDFNHIQPSWILFSYVVGYGDNFPLRPHHRAASCPANGFCSSHFKYTSDPNPNVINGALVGGPKTCKTAE